MSDQVTELTAFLIKPDLDIETPDSEGYRLVSEINEIILNIKGCQKLTWGPQHENPHTYEWAIDFDCTKSQKDFETSPDYSPFMKKVAAIAGGPLTVKSVHFSPPFSKASDAPILELATCYVGSDADLKEIKAIADKFFDFVRTNAKGVVGISSGWTSEDIDSPGGEGKMKALVGAIGWESLEAHMTFGKSDALREAVGPLVAAVKEIEMHHVRFLY